MAEHAFHEVSSGNPSRSKSDRMECGNRPSVNGDRDILPGFDPSEESARVVSEFPRGHFGHVATVADVHIPGDSLAIDRREDPAGQLALIIHEPA